MTRIYYASQYDTPESIALATKINANNRQRTEQQAASDKVEKELCDQYTALLLDQRPTYPTAEHLRAMDQIAELLRASTSYGDHLGLPTAKDTAAGNELAPSFSFESITSRINFHAKAPYRPRTGTKLWSFTDTEINDFAKELKKRDITLLSSWNHDDGFGIVIDPKLAPIPASSKTNTRPELHRKA